MSYRVIRVSNRSELRDSINLPFEIYRDDKNWVAPIKSELKRTLDVKKNPYFRFASLDLFNCYRNKKIVARISLSVNEAYCKKAGLRTGFFGFFEAFKDPDAAKYSLDEGLKCCRANGIQRIEGPFNPNLYSEVGMLCTNFDLPPSFFQTYNPDYYNSLLKENGFNLLEVVHTRINKNSYDYLNKKFSRSLELQIALRGIADVLLSQNFGYKKPRDASRLRPADILHLCRLAPACHRASRHERWNLHYLEG